MEARRALPLFEEVPMRKKLILLTLALSTTAAAALIPVRSAEAKVCNGFLSCCDGICHCCSRPCPPAC